MTTFNIQLKCAKCNCTSFEMYDKVQAKEKDVYALSMRIASEGTINFNKFKFKCANCKQDTMKLIYTPSK